MTEEEFRRTGKQQINYTELQKNVDRDHSNASFSGMAAGQAQNPNRINAGALGAATPSVPPVSQIIERMHRVRDIQENANAMLAAALANATGCGMQSISRPEREKHPEGWLGAMLTQMDAIEDQALVAASIASSISRIA